MEVVSPKLNTTLHLSSIFADFWEAVRVHFTPERDISCGGHVHITPANLTSKFSLRSLKRIAFATIVYEDFVQEVLPQARRENKFCVRNSQSQGSGLNETLTWHHGPAGLRRAAAAILSKKNEVDLWIYMQGNRYVLWNFQNTFPNPKTGRCTGTVEFRGGNQFLATSGVLAWLAFVIGFITLALQEVGPIPPVATFDGNELIYFPPKDLLHKWTSSHYTPPQDPQFPLRAAEWWKRLRRAAKKSKLSRHLPSEYTKMRTT